MRFLKRIIGQREFSIFVIVVAIFIIMSFTSPYFLTKTNIHSLVLALSVTAIIAVGMTNLLISGGFDLSVGSVVGFTGIVAALLVKKAGMPLVLAIIITLVLGALIGLFNGFMVSKVGINPFIVTLAGLSLFRGLTYIVNRGQQVAQLGDAFNSIGQAVFLDVQLPIYYALLFVIIGDVLLRKNKFLRQNYFIGGNEKASRLLGIHVDKVKIINYMLMSTITAFAGIVMTSRMGAAMVYAGTGLELRVITAVIIGGASLSGGEGSAIGAFLGSLIMVLTINILSLLNVSIYWQTFVIGGILLLAVTLDTLNVKRRERSIKKT